MFSYSSLKSVGVAPGDEYQVVILDSVSVRMYCGYGDRSTALYCDHGSVGDGT
jgi:hypothetical protein